MKAILVGLYILVKLFIFMVCLVICMPLAYAFPAYFTAGITRFQHKCIDDVERGGLYTKEQADELRKEIDDI